MLRKLAILTIALVASIQTAAAFNVIVPAQERRCFFETLDKGDNLHVSFQVGEGGHLDVDFWVRVFFLGAFSLTWSPNLTTLLT
jgi:hypothetical protein